MIRIPLRPKERDVLVDLQPLIDRVYQTGRYWRLDYAAQPGMALKDEDFAWARAATES